MTLESAFSTLCAEAQACVRCPAMAGRRRVLSAANGQPGARVLFVGEAPGRLGGERTGVPFSGDQTGRNFAALLALAGLTREEVFITNALLCNPQDAAGRNRPPLREELANCRNLLAQQIAVIDAPLVVTLGAVALAAVGEIAAHGLRQRDSVGQPHSWQGRVLLPLYHPGPRAQLHRALVAQEGDFLALGDLVRAITAGTFRLPETL